MEFSPTGAPFFGDFQLSPLPDNTNQIELEWTEKGEDIPFKAHLLSDGTLRFICLATVFMQPEELGTIIIDNVNNIQRLFPRKIAKPTPRLLGIENLEKVGRAITRMEVCGASQPSVRRSQAQRKRTVPAS